jgi:hypothetical protein
MLAGLTCVFATETKEVLLSRIRDLTELGYELPSGPADIIGVVRPHESAGHDSAVVNAGVSVQWAPRFSTYVSYDDQLGRDRYDSNGVSGGCRILF